MEKRFKKLDNFANSPASVILSEVDRTLGLLPLRALYTLSPSKAVVLDLGWTPDHLGSFIKLLMPECRSKILV